MLAVSMIPDASGFLIGALVLTLAFLIDRLVFRPVLGIINSAINVGNSVSRVGGSAQIKAMRHQPRRSRSCICP